MAARYHLIEPKTKELYSTRYFSNKLLRKIVKMGTTVTRNGQITIDKHIREELGIEVGTALNVNRVGEMIIITKKDKAFWRKRKSELSPDFNISRVRKDSTERYKRLLK